MERIGDVGVFRLEGECRLDPAVKLIAGAIRAAQGPAPAWLAEPP